VGVQLVAARRMWWARAAIAGVGVVGAKQIRWERVAQRSVRRVMSRAGLPSTERREYNDETAPHGSTLATSAAVPARYRILLPSTRFSGNKR
jgi:hypothetical protein